MQEVQTWVWVYELTTIETIEAVGTSSPKIIEGRQTKWWHYISECTAEWQVRISWDAWDSRRTSKEQSTDFAVTSTTWKMEFVTANYWVRIPAAWSYEATMYWVWRWAIVYIQDWDRILYTKEFEWNDGVQSETVTFRFDAWRFDIITLWGKFYYWWSSDHATLQFNHYPELTIRQL